jgi:glutamine cyclotransferase
MPSSNTLALGVDFATVAEMGVCVGAFRRRKWSLVGAAMVLIACAGCGSASTENSSEAATATPATVPLLVPTVIAETSHDSAAFTEGLVFDGPRLYESTGQVGQSQLRELDPASGAVLRKADLPPDFFGEGVAVVGDRIWQLTWRNGVAIEWDKAAFTPLRQVPLAGTGWGLCYDGSRLIRSDGTDRLHFHDPASFAEIGSVSVTYEGDPLGRVNELECVDGQVWANVFETDRVVRIDPDAGKVTAVVDARRLVDDSPRTKEQALNGIAFAGNDEFVLTGKYWPTMFRVRLGE